MRVAFRTDASARIGTGHLSRCLSLAHGLRAKGAEVTFVSRAHPGEMSAWVRKQGFGVVMLPPQTQDLAEPLAGYLAWLGTTQERDAEQTLGALKDAGEHWDWLVVDHYALDLSWERRVRPALARGLMVVDDLADRSHSAELLLDQGYYRAMERRYEMRVTKDCRQLLGPRYALLRDEFRSVAAVRARKPKPIERLLVFFGGVDATNETEKTLIALQSLPEAEGLTVDVVLGASNPHRAAIERRVNGDARFALHVQIDYMARLMGEADLAVGAGGSTAWERMVMGLPCLVVAVAENQIEGAQVLAEDGFQSYLGLASEVTAEQVARELQQRLGDWAATCQQGMRGQTLVDGEGALRVASALYD